ncbi:MAG: DUF2617 family protein [Planctomycetota bacterium]
MSVPAKSTCLQNYQIILYNRALHPELFELNGRRVERHGDYELETWIMPGSHMLRFGQREHCSCELVTPQERDLPTHGVISAAFCAGERDYEHAFEPHGVTYLSTVQTETLSENLYIATFDEMNRHALSNDSLVHRWDDEHGRNLSMLDCQQFNTEVHVQSFHLLAQGGLVLRTQTIFETARS